MARPSPVLLAPFNGGLAVARGLSRRGESVRVLASPSDAFTAATRAASGEVLPPLPEGRDVWLERLAAQGSCAVLTGSDLASDFLGSERSSLPGEVLTFENAGGAHAKLMNKQSTYELAERAGVRYPRTRFVSTPAELEAVAGEMVYPCVMKPCLSHVWRSFFGDDRVLLASTPGELVEGSRAALEKNLELLVSEYVPGGDDAVEEAIVVRAEDGSYPVAFGCRKIRQHPAGFGAASLCVTAPIPESMALAKRLLDEAGFVGVAGIETKRHAQTGEHFLLEVNVRIPTQWGLGDAAGGDSSWRLYATLAGEPVGEQPPIRQGVKLVFPELEIRAALRALATGNGGGPPLRKRLASWRGAGDLGILDRRDPGPALALARGFVGRRVSALAPRRRHRA